MEYDLIIRNAHVYAPQDLGQMDVAVTAGKIAAIEPEIAGAAGREINGAGKILLPGVIETHAHMSMPFAGTKTMNTFYDGTYAGAFGGVTALVDFAQQYSGVSLEMSLRDRLEEARGRCVVDYGFHITLTRTDDATIAEIPRLCEAGYTSFKVHTTYKGGGLYIDTPGLKRCFAAIGDCGGIVTVHAENDDMIENARKRLLSQGKESASYFPLYKPDEAEEEAVIRCIRIAKETRCKLLIRHISSAAAAASIFAAQEEGYPIYAETCPQYLAFTREVYARDNGRDYILHPPIRGEKDRDAIWEAIQKGIKITIATDDCGFYLSQKHMDDTFYGVPGGLPGLETRLLAMYSLGIDTGRISLSRLAEMTAELPAKLYGLYPQKGTLKVGSDGDMVLLDPARKTTITAAKLHERADYTPFEGMCATASLDKTIARGKVIVDGETFLGKEGEGQLLKRELPMDIN